MEKNPPSLETLSSRWKHGIILTLVFGFTVLTWLAARSYRGAPPVPERVLSSSAEEVFTGRDILAGQQGFLRYGLMDNGSIWGHGAYLGPDYSTRYLHAISVDARNSVAEWRYGRLYGSLPSPERDGVDVEVRRGLKQNHFDPSSGILIFGEPEIRSHRKQIAEWAEYFARPAASARLPAKYIGDPEELPQLTAFFAWTAWASAAVRPGKTSRVGYCSSSTC